MTGLGRALAIIVSIDCSDPAPLAHRPPDALEIVIPDEARGHWQQLLLFALDVTRVKAREGVDLLAASASQVHLRRRASARPERAAIGPRARGARRPAARSTRARRPGPSRPSIRGARGRDPAPRRRDAASPTRRNSA